MNSLSILIPTLPERNGFLSVLQNSLARQTGDKKIQIVTDPRDKSVTIGQKRDEMIRSVSTDYIVFIDDDDAISHDYLDKVYAAIQYGVDVVGLCGMMTTNRQNPQSWIISKKYDWGENQDGYKYVRYPNHLAPIKRDIAVQIGYKHNLKHGEDYAYSMDLKNSGLISSEYLITDKLYEYLFRTNK